MKEQTKYRLINAFWIVVIGVSYAALYFYGWSQ